MSATIFISAGEASGEHYGALLVAELTRLSKTQNRKATFFGMGGERMASAGVERIVRAEDVAVMGLTEVVRHLPRIYGEFRKLKRAIRQRRPDVAILIDFPEIHLRLAKLFRTLGIPVVYFVSPQIWAWKQHRIHQIRRDVSRMAVIFPFEEAFYRQHGVRAEFVGHPLAELPLPTVSRERFAAENGLDAARTWIGLLPGSRPYEIRNHLTEMLAAARLLSETSGTSSEFLIPLAPTLDASQRAEVQTLVSTHDAGLSVHLLGDARATLFHARASVVASGTATVEAALIGNPFIVVYRVSPLTFAIAKRVVKVTHVSMANLIAGREIVPELLQEDFQAAKIAEHLRKLLPDGPARASMQKDLAEVGAALRHNREDCNTEAPGAVEQVAAIALEEIATAQAKQKSPQPERSKSR